MSNLDKSAIIIQKFWLSKSKYNTTNNIITKFLNKSFVIQKVKSISFKKLLKLLNNQKIINTSIKCIKRIYYISLSLHDIPKDIIIPIETNIKIILTSYLIAYKSKSIFDNIYVLEKELIKSATIFIENFEYICLQIFNNKKKNISKIYKKLTKDFVFTLFDYYNKFNSWKLQNESILVNKIYDVLNKLYLEMIIIENYNQKIKLQIQINIFREKLQSLKGKEALKIYDKYID